LGGAGGALLKLNKQQRAQDTTQTIKKGKDIGDDELGGRKLQLQGFLQVVVHHHEEDKRHDVGGHFEEVHWGGGGRHWSNNVCQACMVLVDVG
jgi:hypothetical protein